MEHCVSLMFRRSTVSLFALACTSAPTAVVPDAGPPDSGEPLGWADGVKLAEAVDQNPDPDVVEVSLEAKVANVTLQPGLDVSMWTYNGLLPGPLIHAKRGDTLIVHFTNHLPEATTIHWHGIRVPAAMDGSEATQSPIAPGGTFDYRFTLPDSGLFWYHPHVDSSAQVGHGLYGAVLVDEPGEALGDKVVLVLSDLSLTDGGTVAPGDESGWFGDYFGREGDLLLVNGRRLPTLKGRPGMPQRWMLVNTARARFFELDFPAGTATRIGSDVGLIATPQPAQNLVLTPGERAEVWFDPSVATDMLSWVDSDRFHIGTLRPSVPLMRFEASADAPLEATPLPAVLRDIVPIDTTDAGVRPIELMELVLDGGFGALGINGKTYADSTPMMVHVGDTEIWEVKNSTSYDHTFHLHGFPFQPLSLNGKAWPVLEWKDTVGVPAMSTVRLAVTFDNRPGMWMLHCHILDHVELGMMAMLHVMP
jgi:FtsP/CotA-like multicopper oxidase with cupredoxin domain